MPLNPIDARKQVAAAAAVAEVEDGMVLGLGTGTTAVHAVAALALRVAAGLSVTTVATSLRTVKAAREAGIKVIDFATVGAIDLCIDGVDEIDAQLRAIKGAGGAMLREKIVASSAKRMIAIADDSKDVAQLGAKAVPVEVLPFAETFVRQRVVRLGADATLRRDAAGQVWHSDQGNVVLDCAFGPIADPAALAAALSDIPGLLGHGLFLSEIDTVFLGTNQGVVRRDRPVPAGDREKD